MTIDQFNQFCASLPHSAFVEQWHGSQVWKIGGKVFAIGQCKQQQLRFTFKTSVNNFEVLRTQQGCRPAPYFASRGMLWIQADAELIADESLRYFLSDSYQLALRSLTKKQQAAINSAPVNQR